MDKLQEVMKNYADNGIKIFPIVFENKIPFKGFKWSEMATADYNALMAMTKNISRYNLAMPTGEVNDAFVLDIDKGHNGYETLKGLEEKLGALPDTVTVNTGGGGKHLYFKYPKGYNITGVASLLGEGVDTRTNGNYVVIPPSVHKTGTQYDWEKGKSIFEIEKAEIPRAWIKALVEASDRSTKKITNTSNTNILSEKILEGNRESSIFSFACNARNFCKSQEDLLKIALAMNATYCIPPLEQKEVKQAVQSAWNYKENKEFKPTFYGLADLKNMEFPGPNWIVPKLMPAGLHILAGKPKAGKSWLILNLAIAISNAGVFLGKYQCNRKKVLYLALEDTGARIQNRLSNLTALGNNLENVIVTHEWPNIKQKGLIYLEQVIIEQKLDLIVIDTLQRFRGPEILKSQNVYMEDYFVMGELKKLADKYNIAIVLVHHLNKSRTGDTFDNVSGSNGIIGACDTIYTLTANEEYRTLSFKGRDVCEDDVYFKLDNGLCMPIDVKNGVAKKKTSPEQQKLLDVFRGKEILGIKEIAELTGYTESNVKVHLSNLLNMDLVERVERGKYRITVVGQII